MDLQAHDHPKGFLDKIAADPRAGRVTIHLTGGHTVTGTVGETGNHSVIIKALSGREFFDAYVRLDAIASIEVQTRS
ncbi:MAG: hypothetical protein AAF389_21100 [Gemmatimonadota bacterium]